MKGHTTFGEEVHLYSAFNVVTYGGPVETTQMRHFASIIAGPMPTDDDVMARGMMAVINVEDGNQIFIHADDALKGI